ncbi:hypothetical protein BU251_08365 [Candidatus Velamenicoccus archaeovorus]|uniref:Uncharacterized protein n=1 Tax=Velamenicoccus archaeovorus TaxID=1930593 RepID=A0A410P6M3_VELA1|nr:hypothetical protein [Candidatus Velamenicoccus archaeovorus]QAT17731.1 hypothetical protein BU251_08365 [Candidatus Velamenicoccus archaeovorus]
MKALRYGIAVVFLLLNLAVAFDAMANIVVRAAVVNPSETQSRKVPFKSYLPKEVKPENIVDMGDLNIAYDPKESAYYVYKDFDLAPRESVLVEIEMEDVWKIPAEELSSIRTEVDKVAKILENTDYRERAKYLKESILQKLDHIERTQTVVNSSPGGYISDYRENLKLLDEVKTDLQSAKTLMVEAKGFSPMLTWKLIVGVVAFLGILGLIFFVIWLRQIKTMSNLTEDFKAPSQDMQPEPLAPEKGEQWQGEEEKKSDLSDIEQRLKQEKK